MKQLIVLALYFVLCKVCFTSADKDPLKAVVHSNWELTSSMYKEISQAASPEGNIVFSPLGVQVMLALCSVGAGGETAKQLLKSLDLPVSSDDMRLGFKQLFKSLPTSRKSNLEIASKIFPASRYNIVKRFNDTAQQFFLSDIEIVNYGDSMNAARTINEWVKQKTHKMITDIVSADGLDVNTAMVLVNAVLFKGEWNVAFDKEYTTQGTFYVNGKNQREIRMMQCYSKFNFSINRELGAKILEVPYKNRTMSLFIILPLDKDGLPNVEAKLATMKLQNIFESSKQYVDMHLSLPIFTINKSLQLNTILEKLEIVAMFGGDADFSGMSPEMGLSVSKVLHTAMIEVNEEGTAASGVQTHARLSPQGERFVVDHPFTFALVSKLTNVVLFVGRYTGDEGETRFTYETSRGGNSSIASRKTLRNMGSNEENMNKLMMIMAVCNSLPPPGNDNDNERISYLRQLCKVVGAGVSGQGEKEMCRLLPPPPTFDDPDPIKELRRECFERFGISSSGLSLKSWRMVTLPISIIVVFKTKINPF